MESFFFEPGEKNFFHSFAISDRLAKSRGDPTFLRIVTSEKYPTSQAYSNVEKLWLLNAYALIGCR